MKASVLQNFSAFTTKFEGRVPYMYTDVKGLVTTGIGNLIDPIAMALGLPWKNADGSPASQDEITSEWNTVKSAWPGIQSTATRSITQLHLDPADIDHIVAEKAAQNEDILRQGFPGYDSLPADGQMLLLSMAWAMGPAFYKGFPHFTTAVNNGDWQTAATQSHMNDVGNPGLVPRNQANLLLAANAGAVAAAGGDPEVLYWPNSVPAGGPMMPGGGMGWGTIAGIVAGILGLAGGGVFFLTRKGRK